MKIFCFDLDGTICFPNENEQNTFEKYGKAKPNKEIIKIIENFYKNGDKIIIHTARRMKTHNGDIQKVLQDVEEITKNWLKENNVFYHELIFGKPFADFYIDDKAFRPEELKI